MTGRARAKEGLQGDKDTTPRAQRPAAIATLSPKPGQSLADGVYDRVLADIMDGAFQENGRLPAEGALAERFAVSRPVIREALARLREDGLIVSRQGSGSYVKAKPARMVTALAPLSSIADMQRCFEFRSALESEAAGYAAERRTEIDIERLHAAYCALDDVVRSGAIGVEEDYAFHLAVASAAHNRFFYRTLEFLCDSISSGMNLTRNLTLRRSAERLGVVQEEHREVLTAIESQESVRAAAAMRSHIENARRRVFEGVEDE